MSLTGLNVRRRIRRRLVLLVDWIIEQLDRTSEQPLPGAPVEPVQPAAADHLPAATVAPTVEPTATPSRLPKPTPPSAPPPPATAAPPAPPPAAAATTALPPLPRPVQPAQASADKQARHWQRARGGLLRFVDERGGSASLRDLHEHSESTYFIAHVSFSRMMEELTAAGLLAYDHDTAIATLTDAGRGEL